MTALAATAVCALEVPPTPTTYLTDLAGAIPATQAAAVEDRLGALERQTGHQVIAVFFPSLEGEALEDFTIRCAERWKVGRKGLDDGIVFFTFVRDRQMRLEVGYGLEAKVPDAVAARLLDDAVRPAFRAGDYGGGVVALADDLGRVFRGDPPPPRAARGRRSSPPSVGFIVLVVAFLLLRAVLGGGRRRGGGGGFLLGALLGGALSGGRFSGGGFSSGGGSFGGGGASGSW